MLRLIPKTRKPICISARSTPSAATTSEAEKTFEQLITLDPNSFLGYYYAGKVMVASKNYAAAEKYYQKALDLNPQSSWSA